MFDLVKLSLIAGNGGNGKVSFRREKFIPKGGPDGGRGGEGGSIYIVGDKHLNTLQEFAGVKEYVARSGEHGGKQKSIGHRGDDLILKVPVGTVIWVLAENKSSRRRRLYSQHEGGSLSITPEKFYLDRPSGNPPPREEDVLKAVSGERVREEQAEQQSNLQELFAGQASQASSLDPAAEEVDEYQILRTESLKNIHLKNLKKIKLAEISFDGQKILVCQGGIGGRGNESFKSSTNTTPLEAEYGTFGEKKLVLLELRLVADVGLIGYPNAGKSTLLSILTKANPKIANYPFTTLEPNLGIFSSQGFQTQESRDVILADIPGLIEGASEGKGLGYDFLRHVHACKVLLYVLSLDEATLFDHNLTDQQRAQLLKEQFEVLKKEIKDYDPSLEEKPYLLSVSKIDLYSQELQAEIRNVFSDVNVILFSAITKVGVEDLKQLIVEKL